MTNFVKSGDHLTLVAPYSVASGGGFKVGNVFGVAAYDALQGAEVECNVEGVYDMAKDASVFSQGDLAYWDDVAKKVTSTVGANLLIGAVEVAAVTGAATVRVNLFGVPGFSGEANGVQGGAHAVQFRRGWRRHLCPGEQRYDPRQRRCLRRGRECHVGRHCRWRRDGRDYHRRAGSGAGSILVATGKATLGADAVVVPTCAATPFKMTAAGKPKVVIATGPLTAGVIEGLGALYRRVCLAACHERERTIRDAERDGAGRVRHFRDIHSAGWYRCPANHRNHPGAPEGRGLSAGRRPGNCGPFGCLCGSPTSRPLRGTAMPSPSTASPTQLLTWMWTRRAAQSSS